MPVVRTGSVTLSLYASLSQLVAVQQIKYPKIRPSRESPPAGRQISKKVWSCGGSRDRGSDLNRFGVESRRTSHLRVWPTFNEGIVEIWGNDPKALISYSAQRKVPEHTGQGTEVLAVLSALGRSTHCVVSFIPDESNLGRCGDHFWSVVRYGHAESPRNEAEAWGARAQHNN
ncbi:hypothetical protein EDB86DRAFT_2831642 [Lactarius hatsudake]|nr:hypothetical protein EDB86DRAFT_2831642 [Lactarius hatsudake]